MTVFLLDGTAAGLPEVVRRAACLNTGRAVESYVHQPQGDIGRWGSIDAVT